MATPAMTTEKGGIRVVHQLSIEQWRRFFLCCSEILGPGDHWLPRSKSFCAYTVFDRLKSDLNYWRYGLLHKHEIGERHIADGGTWGQPFGYDQLAHIIIPRTWGCEHPARDGKWPEWVEQTQEIDALSKALTAQGIDHRLADLVLEVKCF